MSEIDDLERRLKELEREREAINERIKRLQVREPAVSYAVPPISESRPLLGIPASINVAETPAQKLDLFLRLFRCRESVFPKLWENKSKGTKGYSPACTNEWVRGICGKPPNGKVKCSECPSQAFPRLDENAAQVHLQGQATIGTYAIREDDSCVFLACDFDGAGWKADVFLYQSIAKNLGVDVLVERSRSGNGAHAWMFFAEPVPARHARALGTVILSKCGEIDHRLSLESFDRLFPNQDYLPRGGFGNLIALPLQRAPREVGNSVFIDADLKPHSEQWEILSNVRRLSTMDLRTLLDEFLPKRPTMTSADDDVALLTDAKVFEGESKSREEIRLPDGFSITISRGAQISIPLEGLPSKLVTKLKRTASFPNPEFYKLQRMRMQTFGNPRFIFSGELRPDELILPRGVLDKVLEAFQKAGASVVVQDERFKGKRLKLDFAGTLTVIQEEAVAVMKKHDNGVLVAPPGVGKTVMACTMIAKREVSTLVLVHRQQILDQWKSQLSTFLGVNPKDIGVLRGTKKKRTGRLDLAMIQTLTKSEEIEEIASDYGQVIIDECHHIPASSFEASMKMFPAKYVLGLTATPNRKDHLEKILFQQCGPIRHEIRSADGGLLAKRVTIRETGFRLPEDVGPKPPYHVIAHLITTDAKRNAMIVSDLLAAIKSKRFPLVISDRKDQIEVLMELAAKDKDLALTRMRRLDGGMSPKERRETLEQIALARATGISVVVFATASLIGEGFDMPELDALILATPLSFEGRMVQYAGRLHRLAEGKENVIINDYVDSYCAVSLKMYRNRIKAYRKMGYEIEEPGNLFGSRSLSLAEVLLPPPGYS